MCARHLALSLYCAVALLVFPHNAWPELSVSKAEQKMSYPDRIRLIDGHGYIVAAIFLYDDQDFMMLASEGARNMGACLTFLAENTHTRQQRMIALLATYRFDLAEKLALLRGMTDLFDQGLVAQEEFNLAIGPTNEWSTVVVENFGNSDVQTVLGAIAARPGIDAKHKASINAILSGDAVASLQAMRKECPICVGMQH